jgi:hypothetical protein
MALLKMWRAYERNPGNDEPIVTDADVGYDRKRLATALRDDLKAVGVTRGLLFEDDAPNVEPLRFHDLRSTFCTWARRAGKSDAWISERTGHELSGDMINRYDRGATTLEDLAYGPFPAIARALPELAAIADGLRIVRTMFAALNTGLHTEAKGNGEGYDESVTVPGAYIVGARGFEPPTPRSRTECATRLRYAPFPPMYGALREWRSRRSGGRPYDGRRALRQRPSRRDCDPLRRYSSSGSMPCGRKH